jgi:hypothetical protein
MSDETRRAPAAYAFRDPTGTVTAQGRAEAVIGDDALSVGTITVAFLDADSVQAADYQIEIGCWPGGVLVLSQLGRRFDTFRTELCRTRNQARVAGLLAHGTAMPEVFSGAVLGGGLPGTVECQLYDTHLTLIPEDGDLWQLPLGALIGVETTDDPPAVALVTADGRTLLGQMARRRDEFLKAIAERRHAQAQLLQSLTGERAFADGWGVERSRLSAFDALVARWTSRGRIEGVETLLGAARSGEPRFGLAQLLDPDPDGDTPPGMPEGWASFLLVPAGRLVVFELLAGPSAATYVFEADIDSVNRDLQLLHFRRAALALQGTDAEPHATNPYRLALRRLEPLRRLRAATRARVIHGERWAEAVAEAISPVN